MPETIDIRTLVHDHYKFVFGVAYRLCGTVSDAEDLTQEAYCRAQERLQQLRHPGSARGWLAMIVRNEYLSRQRAAAQNVLSLDMLEETDHEESLPREDEIDVEHIQAVIDQLPEKYKTPLILFYFEELSYRDIAKRLDIPQGTVMSRLARAKSYLRARLRQQVVVSQRDGAGE